MISDGKLLSGSRDSLVKVWDLETRICLQTVTGHKAPVLAMAVYADGTRAMTGCADGVMRVWDVSSVAALAILPGKPEGPAEDALIASAKLARARAERLLMAAAGDEPTAAGTGAADSREGVEAVAARAALAHVTLNSGGMVLLGTIPRQGSDKIALVLAKESLVAVQTTPKTVDLFRVRSADDVKRRVAKREKRKRKKREERGEGEHRSEDAEERDGEGEEDGGGPLPTDELEPVATVAASAKVRSFAFGRRHKNGSFDIVVGLVTNSVEVYSLGLAEDSTTPVFSLKSSVEQPGHRSDVRAIALSSDDSTLATVSSTDLKLWSMRTGTCLHTIDTGYGLAVAFVPGNAHVLVGTKDGSVMLVEVASSEVIETHKAAHKGAVWSIDISSSKTGFTTASADKTLKFWDFHLVPRSGDEAMNGGSGDDGDGNKATKRKQKKDKTKGGAVTEEASLRLSVKVSESLEQAEDCLFVRHSWDGRLLAVALLDSTVRVLFVDTHKFFLSLYGHKLPVLSLDISSDSQLLVTGSADKNMKIWGLDFGDCHRSLFAHDDSVTAVRFIPKTHHVVSTGKDRVVKYWDADTFECVMILRGHIGEVWGLAVSKLGDFFVSGGKDKALRVWRQTEEPVFIEEEREKELEDLFEKDDRALRLQNSRARDGAADQLGLDAEGTAVGAGLRTAETLRASERLLEALDTAMDEQARIDLHAREAGPGVPLPPNVLLLGCRSPAEYVLRVVSRIKRSELDEAINLLPLDAASHLVVCARFWLQAGQGLALANRAIQTVISLFGTSIVGKGGVSRENLAEAAALLKQRLSQAKHQLGLNLAGLRHASRDIEMMRGEKLFGESKPSERGKIPVASDNHIAIDPDEVKKKQRKRKGRR